MMPQHHHTSIFLHYAGWTEKMKKTNLNSEAFCQTKIDIHLVVRILSIVLSQKPISRPSDFVLDISSLNYLEFKTSIRKL